MPNIRITREEFLEDRHGRTFADVVNDDACPFAEVLNLFNEEGRQRRMEEAEIHHDRAPLAGVVRELEAHPVINRFLAGPQHLRAKRFRQAVGTLVRMVMQRRGWRKTGRKGSLGVRAATADGIPAHNTGGLAFWFLRAERYELDDGMPYRSVRQRCEELEAPDTTTERTKAKSTNGRRQKKALRHTNGKHPGIARRTGRGTT